jgi:pimeloyl-ACP methyl ester carboxylesterase
MFALLDRYLLRRPVGLDDWTLSSVRIDGSRPAIPIIYFLPWNTPFWLARRIGLICGDFTACYELAPALVSSEPTRSVAALKKVTDDAEALLDSLKLVGRSIGVVGYSLGTYPATYLANRLRARLYSVAPADRGDLMIWESPAARPVRERALAKGYGLEDYKQAMSGYNPIDNLQSLEAGSAFIVGSSDPFVPAQRSHALIDAVRRNCRTARILETGRGHVSTLLAGARYLRRELRLLRCGEATAFQSASASTGHWQNQT